MDRVSCSLLPFSRENKLERHSLGCLVPQKVRSPLSMAVVKFSRMWSCFFTSSNLFIIWAFSWLASTTLFICLFCCINHQEAIWTSKPRSDGRICRMENEIWQRIWEKQAVARWTFKGTAYLLETCMWWFSSEALSTVLTWECSSQVKASLTGTARHLELLQKVNFGVKICSFNLFYMSFNPGPPPLIFCLCFLSVHFHF